MATEKDLKGAKVPMINLNKILKNEAHVKHIYQTLSKLSFTPLTILVAADRNSGSLGMSLRNSQQTLERGNAHMESFPDSIRSARTSTNQQSQRLPGLMTHA